jgi:hypothetical protein
MTLEVSEVLIAAAIETRLKQNFDTVWASQPPVKLLFSNTKPKSPVPPYGKVFVAFAQGVDGEAFGGNRIDYRKLGLITVQIFTENGIGEKQGRSIGGVVKQIFQGQQFATVGEHPIVITCREYELTTVGVDPKDSTLYQHNARVPFDYHESTTY